MRDVLSPVRVKVPPVWQSTHAEIDTVQQIASRDKTVYLLKKYFKKKRECVDSL